MRWRLQNTTAPRRSSLYKDVSTNCILKLSELPVRSIQVWLRLLSPYNDADTMTGNQAKVSKSNDFMISVPNYSGKLYEIPRSYKLSSLRSIVY